MRCSSGVWAGLAFAVIFVGSIALMVGVTYNHRMAAKRNYEWWERSVIYHIFTPSFYDSNDDGYGDLRGIDDKLNYIVDLGVDSVFLSAFYEFGGVDMGYDVVNHMTVDPTFGSDRDLEALLISLQEKGLKLIVDFVPNHTSNKHEWFDKTVHWNDEGNDMYKDYYIWRNASNWQDNPSEENRKPPNSWTCSVPGLPAWTFDETRNQYYLHTLLPEMPDLNLANENVRSEIKDIFKFWLSRSPIFGVRIGAFNLLFEDESDQTTEVIKSDVEATLEFLDELRDIAEDLADADGTKRLFLVEMVQTDNLMKWQETYRNATLERGNVIPFNLGILPWKDPTLSGDDVHQSVQDYIAAIPQEEVEKRANALLCWEMDNHDKFAVANDSSRMPYNLNEVGMMITMLLPGTMMIYYGDEIGMSDSDMIKCADTVDPYALPPYASECKDFPSRSRDPGRAPMQWNNETHSGFTNGDPWLPLSSSYLEVNVEVEQGKEDSKLNFFKKLLQLRQEDPIYHGEVFYPYHDKNIFSFLRMDEDSKIGLLVVVNIHEVNDIELNIHSVMPGVPNEGMIRLVTSNGESEANYEIGSTIELNEIMLNGYEGLVIEVDFNPSEEGEH